MNQRQGLARDRGDCDRNGGEGDLLHAGHRPQRSEQTNGNQHTE